MLALAGLLSACTGPTDPRVPGGYDSDYQDTIAAAERGGQLVIWSTTDDAQVKDLLAAFRRRYPRIAVTYRDMPGLDIYTGFLADLKHGRPPADLLWNSAMDLQIKLVNDGYAQRYASPEGARIAAWATWKDQAWGTSAEPIVFAYNRRLIDAAAVPPSHAAFERLLAARPPSLLGRVGTYDPATSAAGFLYLMQDQQATHDLWGLVRAMGRSRVRLFDRSEDILREVAAGRLAIGYNVVGSYAIDEMTRSPDLGVVLPRDYTLAMSRIAIIPVDAPHPAAARLFLDHLLSATGQAALARRGIAPVRDDVARPAGLAPGATPYRAIRVGPALLVSQDRLTRQLFLRRWAYSLAGLGPSGRPLQRDAKPAARR